MILVILVNLLRQKIHLGFCLLATSYKICHVSRIVFRLCLTGTTSKSDNYGHNYDLKHLVDDGIHVLANTYTYESKW